MKNTENYYFEYKNEEYITRIFRTVITVISNADIKIVNTDDKITVSHTLDNGSTILAALTETNHDSNMVQTTIEEQDERCEYEVKECNSCTSYINDHKIDCILYVNDHKIELNEKQITHLRMHILIRDGSYMDYIIENKKLEKLYNTISSMHEKH
jgi:hypothetical protein